jgi:hypothetical protein
MQVAHPGVTRVHDRIVGAEMIELALNRELALRALRAGQHAVGCGVGNRCAGRSFGARRQRQQRC